MNFGRVLTMECVNVAPPLDARCDDPAFAIANPSICGVQSSLLLKPGIALVCLLGSIQFKVFSVTNGVETDVTDEAVFTSGDLTVVVIGASSGNATGLAAGEAVITASWGGKTATAVMTVLSGDNCCEEQSVATMLVMDTTRSMSQAFGGTYAKRLNFAKAAALRITGEVNEAKDTIGLIQFHGTTVTTEDLIGTDVTDIETDVTTLSETTDKTAFYDALTEALAQLNATTADRKMIVLISDGDDTLTSTFDSTNDPILLLSDFKAQGGIVMCIGVRAADTGFAFLSAMATGGFFINAYPDNYEEALDYVSGLKGYICSGNCNPAGDEYVALGEVNYDEFINWDVTDGSFDLCGPGYFDLLPGNGLYVDMLGTSYPQTGILTSKATFNLVAGHNYRISFDLAGNQRSDQGTQSVRVRVIPTSGAADLLDTSVGVADFKQDFQTKVVNFNCVGDTTVNLSFNQVEWAGVGPNAKIGLLLDNIRFEDVTDGTLLLSDNFDTENLTFVEPGCGPGSVWHWIVSQSAYGYGYGTYCDGDGCLDEPPSAQLPDPNPLPDIESGGSPPSTTYTSTKTACASCPAGTADVGSKVSPIVSAAYSKITALSEANNGTVATEAWLAFDDDDTTYWASDGSVPQWLQVKLEVAATVTSYGLRTLFVGKPTAWKLYGSNDGTTWTELDDRTDDHGTLLIENIENVFSVVTPGEYLYYRITVSAVNSKITYPGDPAGGVERVGILEFALYEAGDEQACMSATATSTASQHAADQLAYDAALALAEAELNCRALYTSTQSYTAKCTLGSYGVDVTESATRTSYVSQSDADLLAYEAAKDAAEAALDCTLSNNEEAITINDDAPAVPYPSVKYVEGETGVIGSINVDIYGFSHDFPPDVMMVLVSPAGTAVVLMQNCGDNDPGVSAVTDLDINFDDDSPVLPETGAALTTGTFKPTKYGADANLPAPAPAGPYLTTLAAFAGEDPNGAWALYICDDTVLDTGSISDGWDITFL